MPRTAVVVTTISRSGVLPGAAGTDAVNDLTVPNDGKTFLQVANAHATLPYNLEVEFSRTVDGSVVTKKTFAIPALTTDKKFGPWPPSDYGDALAVNIEDANLSVRGFRLP